MTIPFGNPDMLTLAGIFGVTFYLASYFLLQAGFLRGQSYSYAGLNLLGASLVLISLVRDFNLFSAIIQVSWIAISLLGLCRVLLRNRRLRFSEEEQTMVSAKLSAMYPAHARRLLDLGHWVDVTSPTRLIDEGHPTPALFYLSEGEARVESEGLLIAMAQPESFLGEVTVLSREPATATITAMPGARLLRVGHEPLTNLVKGDRELAAELEIVLNSATRSKLAAMNQRVRDAELRCD